MGGAADERFANAGARLRPWRSRAGVIHRSRSICQDSICQDSICQHMKGVEPDGSSQACHGTILRSPTAAERSEITELEKKLAAEQKIELHKGRSREEAGK